MLHVSADSFAADDDYALLSLLLLPAGKVLGLFTVNVDTCTVRCLLERFLICLLTANVVSCTMRFLRLLFQAMHLSACLSVCLFL